MLVAILAIGTEVTRGEIVNTNAAFLARRVSELGGEISEHVVVPDEIEAIAKALERLGQSNELIVSTGGLGPTSDDLSAQAVAHLLKKALVLDEGALESVRKRLSLLGRPMRASHEKLALLPEGARPIPNPEGMAPGFVVNIGRAKAFFLPGVPREMERMFEESIAPFLVSELKRSSHVVYLRAFGEGESAIAERLSGLEKEFPGLRVGYRIVFPEIEIRLLMSHEANDAASTLGLVAQEVRRRLGTLVYGEGNESFSAYVGRLLRERGLTIAVAESCTGGLVGQLLTSVPGSSDYFLLDAVTYSNGSKVQLLGVNPELIRAYGAVSAEVAAEMANGVVRISGAELGLSITGIAGPGGGNEVKPVGTVWMALARKDEKAKTRLFHFSGERERIRMLAAYHGLRWVAETALAWR
ncbi:MAG: competence/damage-inducible protein A [Deltaproteobacteria bacterium]|nr:competence/damage-inducible protein A [Deltaproteobacteria bacterium]